MAYENSNGFYRFMTLATLTRFLKKFGGVSWGARVAKCNSLETFTHPQVWSKILHKIGAIIILPSLLQQLTQMYPNKHGMIVDMIQNICIHGCKFGGIVSFWSYIDSTRLRGDEKQTHKQTTVSSFRIENPSSCFVSFSWGHAESWPPGC